MKMRETATKIHIQNRASGAFAPPMYINAKYDDAKKQAQKTNTLLVRFPEKWMCW